MSRGRFLLISPKGCFQSRGADKTVRVDVLIGKNGEWMMTKHPQKFTLKWLRALSPQIDSFFARSLGRY